VIASQRGSPADAIIAAVLGSGARRVNGRRPRLHSFLLASVVALVQAGIDTIGALLAAPVRLCSQPQCCIILRRGTQWT
jgi:hypothetical protein